MNTPNRLGAAQTTAKVGKEYVHVYEGNPTNLHYSLTVPIPKKY